MKGTTLFKRFAMLLVCGAGVLAAGSASALTSCSLSGPYVANFTAVNPSELTTIGTFTFTPPANCNLPGVVSITTQLGGSLGQHLYFVNGNQFSIPGTPGNVVGLIGRPSIDDGVAEGFVFNGADVNITYGGSAIRSQ